MTKLEELNALMGKSNAAKATYEERPDNYSNYLASANADAEFSYCLFELLPALIAVAEAAIVVSKQKPSTPDYWSSCGQCESNSSKFEDLLLPLTKDADK